MSEQEIISENLPEGVTTFDHCKVPLAVSAFDISRLAERSITKGNIAPALRASCTFPGLFTPVWHPQGVLIDGGVRDLTGDFLRFGYAGGLIAAPSHVLTFSPRKDPTLHV